MTALEYNHQHPSLYCVHLTLARFLYWNCSHDYMCCWVVMTIGSYPNHRWVATSLDCISEQSKNVLYIICYCTHGMILWSYPSNVGHGQILQMFKLQTRVTVKDHDTNDPLLWYLLYQNDRIPKHVKVNVQNLCMNIILFSTWCPKFQWDVAPKNRSQFSHAKSKS